MKIKEALRKGLNSIGYDVRRVRSVDIDVIHYLHIGKCAGTQIGNIIRQINEGCGRSVIVKNGHDVSLRDIPKGSDFFFSIRDPLSRFVSGFYSRKRKGRPRIYSGWSSYEEFSFGEFEEANDLAESLFECGLRGRQAAAAIKSMRHTAQDQFDWFCCCGSFLFVRPPVWIIRQEYFEGDLREFLYRAGFSGFSDALKIEKDSVGSHVNDYRGVPPLSKKAEQNLRYWYAQDIQFYQMCEDWMREAMG
ncbi:sulfotransferase family 2 domain-containing protein [Ectothiorhodospira mobilis]|uniref:sulfotransferase family 2 domain-containing protein n=1 Tax=Ectothiorhodospira mobilis TaxID=195064 RepID=UPI001903928C|nr:sulfotransferase family 2 domain-containing protein [Ectothiorhodospira mobilis]